MVIWRIKHRMPWPILPIVKKTAHGKNSASMYRTASLPKVLLTRLVQLMGEGTERGVKGEKRTAGFPAALPRPSRLESGGGTARPSLPSGQVPRIDFRYGEAAAAPRVAREVHPLRKPVLFLPTADRLAGDVEPPANVRNGVVPIHPVSSSMR